MSDEEPLSHPKYKIPEDDKEARIVRSDTDDSELKPEEIALLQKKKK